MMENIEFLCQAFDSIKLADINKQLNDLETDKQADFVVQTIDDHKQKETARTEALNEKLKVDKAKDTIKSGGWSVNDVQLVSLTRIFLDFHLTLFSANKGDGGNPKWYFE